MNYSPEFRQRIIEMHRGSEHLPLYARWIDGQLQCVEHYLDSVVGHLKFFSDIEGKHILDFGCGTGGLSTALALSGARVTAVDICSSVLSIAQARAVEHAVTDSVTFVGSSRKCVLSV